MRCREDKVAFPGREYRIAGIPGAWRCLGWQLDAAGDLTGKVVMVSAAGNVLHVRLIEPGDMRGAPWDIVQGGNALPKSWRSP